MKKSFRLLLFILQLASCAQHQPEPEKLIRINQIGYYAEQEKVASVVGAKGGEDFTIIDISNQEVVYSGKLSEHRASQISDKGCSIANFSDFSAAGRYILKIEHIGSSYEFTIGDKIYDHAARDVAKGFYYQRSGFDISPNYVGKQYAREAAIMDSAVIIHPSAASADRRAGTKVNSHGGWYDAGDYGKYIVNSAFTVGTMLQFLEDFTAYASSMQLNIDESDNSTPDLMDEIMYNLTWMLTMQDPSDGGVYHKLTSIKHDPFVSPTNQSSQRYIIGKSTAASLGFAASMAQAARIISKYEVDYPIARKVMLEAAIRAYKWATQNPNLYYDQDAQNRLYAEEMNTGAYGDNHTDDEFFWAATQLYCTTNELTYYNDLVKYKPKGFATSSWNMTYAMGAYAILNFEQLAPKECAELKEMIITYADTSRLGADGSPYNASYGRSESDFFWGCNADGALAQAIAFLYAYRITAEKSYLTEAMRNGDYVVGRNATGYCYLTGYGSKSPLQPHHRLFATDNAEKPFPGFLVGGPTAKQEDGLKYNSDRADESYLDSLESYASNEIAINWSAVALYYFGAISALN